MMAGSDETTPIVLEPSTDGTGCLGLARICDRDIVTVEQVGEGVLRWTTLDDDELIESIYQVSLGEPPYCGVRDFVKLMLANLPAEDALSHPIRRGLVLRGGETDQPLLEPISYQEIVDIIAEQARFRAEDAAFAVLARDRAISGWTSLHETWVELMPDELSFVASLTSLPELHVREGDRAIVLLRRPVDGVVAIVLRGEVSFDDKKGWTGIEKLVSSNFVDRSEIVDAVGALAARLLPADNEFLRIEPDRVRNELIDQLSVHQKVPADGRLP